MTLITFNGFKAHIQSSPVIPSLYQGLKEEQRDYLLPVISEGTLPLSLPDNPLDTGLLLYKSLGDNQYEVLTGLLPRLSSQYKYPSSSISSTLNDLTLKGVKPFKKELRSYQSLSVEKIIQQKRGIISIATGGGKTRIIAEVIHQLKDKGLNIAVLVPTINLLHQMKEEIQLYHNNEITSLGLIGGGHIELEEKLTIVIPDTLYSRRNSEDIQSFMKKVEVLLVDEVHLMMNPTCFYVYSQMINTQMRIGLSATPSFNLLLEGVFGPILHEESPQELIKTDIIECPEVIFYKVKPRRLTGNLNQWVISRSITDNKGNFSPFKYSTLTNELIIKHPSRNELIANLTFKALQEGRGPVVIVVSKVDSKVNHPDYLLPLLKERLGFDVPVIKGSNSSSKELIQSLKEGKLSVAIAGPKILQVGTDIPILNCVILATEGKAASSLIQQIGRALRKSSSSLPPLIISFIDSQFPFANQSQSRYSTCVSTYGESNVSIVDDF